jgi:metal-responsive CopG/Arc/MetJ family transcriptional regulator
VVRVAVTLTEKQLQRLNEICQQTGLTRSELLRRIIDWYLEQHPAPQREEDGDC